MKDHLGRKIDYLRVSVTDRCNLRCIYCMPEQGVAYKSHPEILTYEEIERLVRIGAGLGIRRVRLTGGEPLVRQGLVDLVEALRAIPGIEDIALTTNGTLLAPVAAKLRAAGLRRVNISLDTLSPEKYLAITRRDELKEAMAGIEAALAAGLDPVKINVVAVAGVNDDEIRDMAALTLRRLVHVRFIELMPLGEDMDWAATHVLPIAEVRRRVEQVGALLPASVTGNGPAEAWRLPGGLGTVGFIAALSESFCMRCNRLRLTADGRLKPCLSSDLEVDVRGRLRDGAGDEALRQAFAQALDLKPAHHSLLRYRQHARVMYQIGG